MGETATGLLQKILREDNYVSNKELVIVSSNSSTSIFLALRPTLESVFLEYLVLELIVHDTLEFAPSPASASSTVKHIPKDIYLQIQIASNVLITAMNNKKMGAGCRDEQLLNEDLEKLQPYLLKWHREYTVMLFTSPYKTLHYEVVLEGFGPVKDMLCQSYLYSISEAYR